MKSLVLIILIVLQVSALTEATDDSCCDAGRNEFYDKCGTNCEPTCENPNPRCNKSCKAGCFCEKGYIRNKKGGTCIRKKKCQRCDDKTEDYRLGVQPCEDNCATGIKPSCAYTRYIPMLDCFCKQDLIRDKQNGKCISIDAFCPQARCQRSVEDYRCGVKECEYICGVGVPEDCNSLATCKDGCFCKSGFIRDAEGYCIPLAECPSLGNCPPVQ